MQENFDSRSDWELCARQFVALLRRNVRNFGQDSEMGLLIETLKKESPGFQGMWDECPIGLNGPGSLRMINSRMGSLELQYETFFVSDVSPLVVVVMKVSP